MQNKWNEKGLWILSMCNLHVFNSWFWQLVTFLVSKLVSRQNCTHMYMLSKAIQWGENTWNDAVGTDGHAGRQM